MLITGTINRLTVDRKTDIGYMLTHNDDSVFLHFNESLKQDLQSGDIVDAFIYIDGKGRQAATLKMPKITIKDPASLKVNDVLPHLGVFLDMGISKDVLLSVEDLPSDPTLWPRVGEYFYVALKIKGKMVAKPVTSHDVDAKKALELKSSVDATVQRIGQQGLNLLTDDGVWIFVHRSMFKGDYHLGERVNVQITFQSERGYSGSLMKQKENMMTDDAAMILKVLEKVKEIPIDSNASPEAIKAQFGLSKKAFKRAIGHLYKERKIDFIDGKTVFKGV